jgi:amino acid transporter/nucleotide-binding universal stress UspA family protein
VSKKDAKNSDIKVSLSRELGLFDITMLGIAAMIGAGIFALTGIAAGIAGPALLIAFFLNGVVATLTSLAYAELGSAMPEAGGAYPWVREAMGGFLGYLSGWCCWTAQCIACSLYAVTFGAFLSELTKTLPIPQVLAAKVYAVAIVTLLAYINYSGVKESGRVGGFVTLAKLVILLIFIVFGVYATFARPDWIKAFTTPSFFPHGFSGVLAAMGLTYIAFEGYDIIVQSGEEVREPEKNIPKAVVLALWISVSIYLLVAFAAIGSVRTNIPGWMYLGKLKEFGLIKVADQIMPFGGFMIILGGLISTVSAMNATIYSSSRVAFAMGRDRYLPSFLAKIHDKNRTPHLATLFSYTIIATMAVLPIEVVATAADIMFLVLFILVNIVLVILRYRRPDIKRPFKVPAMPWLPISAIVLQVIIGYFLVTEIKHGDLVLGGTALWMLFGYAVYSVYSKKEIGKKLEAEVRTVYEERPVEEKFKVLVPVANPVMASKLANFAATIAKSREGEVILLNVVTVPEQTPLSAGMKYVKSAKEFLNQIIDQIDVPCGGMVKIGHRSAEAILNAVEEVKPDLLIMGWRGRTFRKDFVIGSTIDPILVRAKCDVVVVRFELGEVRKWSNDCSVLIPTAGGPHAVLAAELARDFAKKGRITLMYVGKSEKYRPIAEKIFRETEEPIKDLNFEKKFIVSSNPVNAIVRESAKYDLVMLGASNRPFLKNFLLGLFPEKIVNKTSKTVVMVRRWVSFKEVIKPK